MKLTAKQSALLSERERSMLSAKGPWEIKQLVSLIKRSRELRDKYRQQAQRQSIAATERTLQKPHAANARTLQKANIFDGAILYFEAQLDKISSECDAAMRELKVGKNPVRSKTQAKKSVLAKAATAKKPKKKTRPAARK